MADGLGRGRTAVDIQLCLVPAVGAQMRGQYAAVGRLARLRPAPPARPRRRRRRTARRCRGRSSRGCAKTSRRRSPAPACRRRERRKLSAVASAKTKPEHTACRSKAAPWLMPSPFWTATAVAGKVLSGVEVASTIRSIDCASMPASVERGARGIDRQMRGELALGGDVALPDAGALHDPLVGRIDPAPPVRHWSAPSAADRSRSRARPNVSQSRDSLLRGLRLRPAHCRRD